MVIRWKEAIRTIIVAAWFAPQLRYKRELYALAYTFIWLIIWQLKCISYTGNEYVRAYTFDFCCFFICRLYNIK